MDVFGFKEKDVFGFKEKDVFGFKEKDVFGFKENHAFFVFSSLQLSYYCYMQLLRMFCHENIRGQPEDLCLDSNKEKNSLFASQFSNFFYDMHTS